MADPVAFQYTVGTAAVTLGAVTALTGVVGPVVKSGVKVNPPSSNSGYVAYGFTSAITAATGDCYILNNGQSETINPGEFGRDLGNLYIVGSTTGQVLTGVVI